MSAIGMRPRRLSVRNGAQSDLCLTPKSLRYRDGLQALERPGLFELCRASSRLLPEVSRLRDNARHRCRISAIDPADGPPVKRRTGIGANVSGPGSYARLTAVAAAGCWSRRQGARMQHSTRCHSLPGSHSDRITTCRNRLILLSANIDRQFQDKAMTTPISTRRPTLHRTSRILSRVFEKPAPSASPCGYAAQTVIKPTMPANIPITELREEIVATHKIQKSAASSLTPQNITSLTTVM